MRTLLTFRHFRADLAGGVTAAVVALPLALAFGVSSGAGPIAGLYGAILVGFFASLFGGTPSQVSGPTGPMTVVMAAVVMQYAGEPAVAFTVVMMGGLLQILFGALRLGRYIAYMPVSVISGFMTGIGAIIIILQLAPFVGQPASAEGVLGALADLPKVVAGLDWGAAILGALTLAIVGFTPYRLRRLLPPPLIALVVATLVGMAVFPGVAVIGDVPKGLPPLYAPSFDLAHIPDMLSSAVVLALLGSIDTLLTSLVADQISRGHHNSNRELIGQGIGNLVAGIFGGLPGAGATMRTVVNVRAGGRSNLSGMIHALVLLALVLGLGGLVSHIPLAVLAGLLLKVGWDIIDWNYLRRMRGIPREKMIVMLTVTAITVFADLITAVAVGFIMAALLSARQMGEQQMKQVSIADGSEPQIPLTEEERAKLTAGDGKILLMRMTGPFSFASSRDLVRRLSMIGSPYRVLIFDFTDLAFIDATIAMAIETLFAQAREHGQTILVVGLDTNAMKLLERMRVLDGLADENRFVERLPALSRAAELVAEANS